MKDLVIAEHIRNCARNFSQKNFIHIHRGGALSARKRFGNKIPESLFQDYVQSNRAKCDALGCEQEATEQIMVSAGKFGSIGLSVCLKCVSKFLGLESAAKIRDEDNLW